MRIARACVWLLIGPCVNIFSFVNNICVRSGCDIDFAQKLNENAASGLRGGCLLVERCLDKPAGIFCTNIITLLYPEPLENE